MIWYIYRIIHIILHYFTLLYYFYIITIICVNVPTFFTV